MAEYHPQSPDVSTPDDASKRETWDSMSPDLKSDPYQRGPTVRKAGGVRVQSTLSELESNDGHPLVGLGIEKKNPRRLSPVEQDALLEDEAEGDEEEDDETKYPPTKEVVSVMSAILLAVFLVSLDRTIIATAIPKITDEFHSLQDVGWYGSAFLLTSCAFQLLLGKVYTFYPPKYVFLLLITLFEVGSAICGAAPNSVAFIVGRAIAGIGSAGIMAGAIILMVAAVPLRKRPVYQGLFGAVFGISSVLAPLIGGALTTNVSWRWCFYLNLPVGVVVLGVILFILKTTPAQRPGLTIRQQLAQLDLLGQFFLLPCVVCLLLALQWGGSTYPWSSARIVALLVMFSILMIGFILVQIMFPKSATIPISMIKNRSIIGAMWFIFFLSAGMMLIVYYTSIWFQAIKGRSAVQSGVDSIPLVLSLVVGSIVSGQIVGRTGYYTPVTMACGVLMPIGAGLIATWKPSTGHAEWIGFQILYGFALGLGMQQAGMVAQTVLRARDVPTGVSLMFFWQTLGAAIFVSVGQNVLDSHLISGLSRVARDISPAVIVKTGATELRKIVPASDLPAVLHVYNNAIRQVFLVSVVLGCLSAMGSFILEFKSVKTRQPRARPTISLPMRDSNVGTEMSDNTREKDATVQRSVYVGNISDLQTADLIAPPNAPFGAAVIRDAPAEPQEPEFDIVSPARSARSGRSLHSVADRHLAKMELTKKADGAALSPSTLRGNRDEDRVFI